MQWLEVVVNNVEKLWEWIIDWNSFLLLCWGWKSTQMVETSFKMHLNHPMMIGLLLDTPIMLGPKYPNQMFDDLDPYTHYLIMFVGWINTCWSLPHSTIKPFLKKSHKETHILFHLHVTFHNHQKPLEAKIISKNLIVCYRLKAHKLLGKNV